MTDDTAQKDAPSAPRRSSDPRSAERMAAALRENLRRRKQQARARRADDEPHQEGETSPAKG